MNQWGVFYYEGCRIKLCRLLAQWGKQNFLQVILYPGEREKVSVITNDYEQPRYASVLLNLNMGSGFLFIKGGLLLKKK